MVKMTRMAARMLIALALAIIVPAAVLLGTGAPGAALAQSGTVISRVAVEGNNRVEPATVVSYIRLGAGDRYDPGLVNDSLKALFGTGLFSDVQINLRGTVMVVAVVENPIINRVAFEGNRKLEDATLGAEVELKPRSVLTRTKVQSDVQRILVLYRRTGRFSATVEPKIIQLPQNRVDLVFEINEGGKTGINRISFIGNRAFDDGELREVITTGESNILSWLKSDDVYDPDRLAADQELLRRFYLKNGYADFRIVSAVADLDRERNSFIVTITVDEGEQYQFGEIRIDSNLRALDPSSISSVVQTVEGDVYNLELVDQTVEDLTLEVSKFGYAFAQARPVGDRDPVSRTVSITYVIEEGPRVYVERIDIRGNTRTHEDVIRREFDFAEGDAFNRVLLDRAQRRLNALGFFEKVNISREPGGAQDRVIIVVEVEEKATGQLSLGVGYSTSDGILGDISIAERNLMGRGQFVRLALSVSAKRQDVDFSFTEPYFMGRRVSAGIDLFARELDLEDESSFDSRRRGGGLRFGFPLTTNWSLTTRYQASYEEVRNVGSVASPAIQAEEGSNIVSLVGYSFRYDTLDNRRDPRNGLFFSFSQDVAGVGGDVSYLRSTVEGRAYHELFKGVVALFRVQGGHITGIGGEDVRILDAFFKGGETIRGFERAGLGPRDATTGDTLGGKIFAAATAELQFPIWGLPDTLGFKGAIFGDIGTVYDTDVAGRTFDIDGDGVIGPGETAIVSDSSDVRSSVGFSIIWNSPLGPLRADIAHVISSQGFDKEQIFRFGGGTQF